MLLLAKRGGPAPQNPAYLPIWIAAGIRAEMEEQLGPERLLRSNRQYPITRALLAAGLSLPDFRYMTGGLDPLRFAPGELKWYREFSRLLLEILYGLTSPTDNALFDYAVLSADPAHTAEHVRASTIDRVLRNAAAKSGSADSKEPVDIQRFLEQCARRTVWHLFAPRPPEIAEAEFRKNRPAGAAAPGRRRKRHWKNRNSSARHPPRTDRRKTGCSRFAQRKNQRNPPSCAGKFSGSRLPLSGS
ncbi:MAG: hypothetical protein L6W00_22360 [Lentisphaeria bacterium]|nr:MAG: hypothetical protein L6W00_22360 [Lentisphaeria bacterium]